MIELYSHDAHFSILKEWNDSRGQLGLERWMLPDLGFVCDRKAIAFLVTTNSPVAWIAHWSVSPAEEKEERDELVLELAQVLEREATERGFRILQTLGKVGHNLERRLRELGFLEAAGQFTFFAKNLDQGV